MAPPIAKRVVRSVVDALNANPVVRAGKNLRNALVDRHFSRRARRDGIDLAGTLGKAGTRRPCFAVAFNTPWCIELLCAGWRRHPTGMDLVVVDNSSRREAREAHEAICRAHSVPWLGLPPNPEWSPNRSHGIAMNWIWRNVVLPLEPDTFGFIDHDCFPTRAMDLPACLTNRSVHGFRNPSPKFPGIWNLWAGYSFFRFGAVRGTSIDFKHRVELGLDTGGGNWRGLYRHLPEDRVSTAHVDRFEVETGNGMPTVEVLRLDRSFIHVGGASYRTEEPAGLTERAWRDALWRAVAPGEPRRHS